MGTLIYGHTLQFDIDDRTLAHLRAVVFAKLRGHESLPITVLRPTAAASGESISFWVSADTPLAFRLSAEESVELSREWIDEHMRMSYSNRGLVITPEWAEPVAAVDAVESIEASGSAE